MARRCLRDVVVVLALLLVGCGTSPPPRDTAATYASPRTKGVTPDAAPPDRARPGSAATLDVPVLANRLLSADSAYLTASASQAIYWQPFGDPAFQLARTLDRPVLLDVGATWCHWCAVMARESYDDPAVVKTINDRFVAVKVDADRRPDLDRRYQQAAQLVSKRAGWPLTLFLTPAGDVFAGGTYFPAVDRAGLPGFQSVLESASAAYASQSTEAETITGRLALLAGAGVVTGELRPELVDQLGEAVLTVADGVNGGLGHGAKSPPTQAIELALQQYQRLGDARYLDFATKTLDAMDEGAIHDQLGGAFHRLTLDPVWRSPHFDIVGAQQGAILTAYLRAYDITRSERYRQVAEGILEYLDGTLVDRERGGFYAGQDADVAPEDDGGFYIWTAREIAALLPAEEAAVASRYYGLTDDAGAPGANSGPLRVAQSLDKVSRALGLSLAEAGTKLADARMHLGAARSRRPAPPVDRTFYSDRNGILAGAYLAAYRAFGRSGLRDTALLALDRLAELPRPDGLLAHAYDGQRVLAPPTLDDQVAVAAALLDAFDITGQQRYVVFAGSLIDRTIAAFADAERGGFQDVPSPPGPGAATTKQKPYDDGLVPGGNSLAALTLNRYALLTGDSHYHEDAAMTLRAFAGAAREYGAFAAGYGIALSEHLNR